MDTPVSAIPLLEKVEKMRQKSKERETQDSAIAAAVEEVNKPEKTIRLPKCPVTVRAAPNGILRSALFGAVKRGVRRYLNREKLASIETVDITYTGQRLDQADLDVWLNVLQLVSVRTDGKPECQFTAYAMLKQLGLTDTGKNRDTLNARLTRLKANGLELQQGKYSYMGSLIDTVKQNHETKEYTLLLNPDLSRLFARDQFTQLELAVRSKLANKPLAQWLHGFYSSHAKPFPLKVETLHSLCGSESKSMRSFKADLTKSLDLIVEACKENGERFSYEIQENLVKVKRQPTKSQAKHLSKSTKSK